MSGAPARTRCPGCGGGHLTDVFSSRGVPVFVGLLHDSADEARAAPVGDVTLAFCHGCGLVHNRRFEPAKLAFAPGYDTALVHSPTHSAFLDDLADRLVERHRLRGRTVLEIGCGGGHFARRLCARGVDRVIGVDPSLPETRTERVGTGTVEWRREWFDPARANGFGAWDFACSMSVLEDVPEPLSMVQGLAALCAERGAAAYVEVFHATRAFERDEVWSVHYEQCNYFGLDSLAGLFRRGGFRVAESGECFAGQALYVDVTPDGAGLEADVPELELPPSLERLARLHRAAVEEWTGRLAALAAAGRRVALWGSGGKGVSFLAAVPGSDRIACVVDVNPARQGRWLPGSGLPVVAPEALAAVQPDVVIVTNRLYAPEIEARVASLDLACEILAA